MSSQASQQLRPSKAADLLGVSRATLWRWVAHRHDFPRGRKLSAGVTVFDAGELLAWRDRQPITGHNGGGK